MILGVGTDIIEISRIRKAAERQTRLFTRLFTAAELAHIEQGGRVKWNRAAGKFAAKEAIAKAIGNPCSWHDVEILPDTSGKPIPTLHKRAAGAMKGRQLRISISHSRDYAIAVAILEAGDAE